MHYGWNESDFAKSVLTNKGYNSNFEDVSYRDYQGTIRYTAQNSEGKWGVVSYSYGSCEVCDNTYNWTITDYKNALSEVSEQDYKPLKSDW